MTELESTVLGVVERIGFPSIVGVTFNGTTQEVTTTTQFALASAFSLEAWFKLTSSAANNLGIVTHGSPQTGNFTGSEAGIYVKSGALTCYIENTVPTTTSITPATNYNDGQWHHAVLTFGSGVMTCYVDGIQIGQSTGLGTINATSSWLRIARGNLNNLFPGSVSRVAYYNTALNIGQVNNHFQAASIGFTTYDSAVIADSPVNYWKLIETSGTSAADSAGTNTGTYVNAPTLNQSSAVMAPDGSPGIAWTSGKQVVI